MEHQSVTVLGAGLAGCEAAWQLARRGFPHGVIREAVDRFAGEADAGES